MKRAALILLCVCIFIASFPAAAAPATGGGAIIPPPETADIPAFPGAEGAAKYITGGRGGAVYEVTNLNDSGPGSLREAVQKSNGTIVFRVSGTIQLKTPLSISGSNLTIAGQTAPGDGICVAGSNTSINGNNLIIRYMRFRNGDTKNDSDAFGGRYMRNIMVDHCSTSWSVDETLTVYASTNVSIQWCISSESLYFGGHIKGAHGYGAIFGGPNSTYHHNLLLDHTSRSPRIHQQSDMTVDVINNVIYNWGFNSMYGGETGATNVINNYYKYGPGTNTGIRSKIVEPSGKLGGAWYVNGNYVYEDPKVSADNWAGGVQKYDPSIKKLDAPVEVSNRPEIQSAEDAYVSVLANVGATLPKRDSLDARLINDVKNGRGRFINDPKETGGLPVLNSAPAPNDADHDGMPDAWEKENGLNPNDPDDRNVDKNGNGYTNLENYINSIGTNGSQNPDITISNIELNQLFSSGKSMKIQTQTSDNDGSIAKVAFYSNDQKIGEKTSEPFDFTWEKIPEGTWYISAVATDDSGTATQSNVVPVHINNAGGLSSWKSADIGTAAIKGSSSASDGLFIVKGAGKIQGKADAFQYTYQQMKGNGEIVAKVEDITATDNGATAGIMIRESLSPDSACAFITLSYNKNAYDKGETDKSMIFKTRSKSGSDLKTITQWNRAATSNWMKLKRDGNTITVSYSQDGTKWTDLGSADIEMPENAYIGFAVDAAKGINELNNYNSAKFSNVSSSFKTAGGSAVYNSTGLYIAGGASIFVLAVLGAFLLKRRAARANKQ